MADRDPVSPIGPEAESNSGENCCRKPDVQHGPGGTLQCLACGTTLGFSTSHGTPPPAPIGHEGLRVGLCRIPKSANPRPANASWMICNDVERARSDGYEVVEMMPVDEHDGLSLHLLTKVAAQQITIELAEGVREKLASEREKQEGIEDALVLLAFDGTNPPGHSPRANALIERGFLAVEGDLPVVTPAGRAFMDAGLAASLDAGELEPAVEVEHDERPERVESETFSLGPTPTPRDVVFEAEGIRIATGGTEPSRALSAHIPVQHRQLVARMWSRPVDREALIGTVFRKFAELWPRRVDEGEQVTMYGEAAQVVDALAGVVPSGEEAPAYPCLCDCKSAPSRESAMVEAYPGVWCDACIAPLVGALNRGGIATVASCCGHDLRSGRISLADGRELLIYPTLDAADAVLNTNTEPPSGLPAEPSALELARAFHEEYERLAPSHGYETREASAKPWADVPEDNRNLMVATADAVLKRYRVDAQSEGADGGAAESRDRWREIANKRMEGLREAQAENRRLRAAKPLSTDLLRNPTDEMEVAVAEALEHARDKRGMRHFGLAHAALTAAADSIDQHSPSSLDETAPKHDRPAVISALREMRQTHVDWMEHFSSDGGKTETPCSKCPPNIKETVGDYDHHGACVEFYDAAIAMLSEPSPAVGLTVEDAKAVLDDLNDLEGERHAATDRVMDRLSAAVAGGPGDPRSVDEIAEDTADTIDAFGGPVDDDREDRHGDR